MTDIVERLREAGDTQDGNWSIYDDAADEIERLRRKLDRTLGILADGDGIPKGLDTYETRVEHAIHEIRARSET